MADKMFVTRQTVSNWENGKSQPDIDTLIKIAETFNTDTTGLIYGLPDKNQTVEKKNLAIAIGILFVLGLALYFLTQYAKEALLFYSPEPMLIIKLYLQPLFWLVLGWTLIQLFMGTLGIIKPIGAKYCKTVRIAALSLVFLYTAFMIPYLIKIIDMWILSSQYHQNPLLYPSGFSYNIDFSILNNVYRVLIDVANHPVIFIIPGIVFRFCKPVKQAI